MAVLAANGATPVALVVAGLVALDAGGQAPANDPSVVSGLQVRLFLAKHTPT